MATQKKRIFSHMVAAVEEMETIVAAAFKISSK